METTSILPGAEPPSLVDLLTTDDQRAVIDEVTAVMSLLEGHADVMMDQVGPRTIPTVATIRARFDSRRQTTHRDRLIRRWLGLDAKLRQYRDGAAFCRAVLDEVGVDGFNAVFAAAESLPTPREIHEPARWVRRVHGPRPLTAGP